MSIYSNLEMPFVNRINDLMNKTINNDNVFISKFLNPREQEIVSQIVKNKCFLGFFGGYDAAEYKRCAIAPFPITEYNISLFQIKYNKKFLTIGHKNILGSLISLGIKRDNIGDIIFLNDTFYFFIANEIEEFIVNEFKSINHKPISIVKTDYTSISYEVTYTEKNIYVTSLRLDNVISSAYNISRKASQNLIENNYVKINFKFCTNNCQLINENDTISVRTRGRIIIKKIGNKTKSDHIHLAIGIL